MWILIVLFIVFSAFILWLSIEIMKSINESLQNILRKLNDVQDEIHLLYEQTGGKLSFEDYKKKKSKKINEKLHSMFDALNKDKQKKNKESS